jgi:hypothetical protein
MKKIKPAADLKPVTNDHETHDSNSTSTSTPKKMIIGASKNLGVQVKHHNMSTGPGTSGKKGHHNLPPPVVKEIPNITHNHMECYYHLSNKKALLYNMKAYYDAVGVDPFTVLPLSFHI